VVLNRSRKRAPHLRVSNRLVAGICTLLIRPTRLVHSAIVLKPSTLLHFHQALKKRKYRLLFSPRARHKPGPEGPTRELIDAVVQMKQRNPTWGCPRIAQQVTLAFGIEIDKDVVRRIMAVHFRRAPGTGGPSWLTFLGHMKDSLWSVDLFRCESATLRTHWVLVVMDQYTRKIIGFGMHAGIVDGMSLCRMFQQAIRSQPAPEYLSSDNDPLFRFHQWQARSSPRNRPKVSSSKSSVAGRDRVGTGFPASTDSIVDCRYVQKLLGSATVRAHIALRHAQVLQELELIVAAVFDTQIASEN
jgi:putative transposase